MVNLKKASLQSPVSSLQSPVSSLQSPVSSLQSPVSSLNSLYRRNLLFLFLLLLPFGFLSCDDYVSTPITTTPIYEAPENVEDFGKGAHITQTFSAGTASEWNDALTAIRNGGNNKNYIINITESFSIPGSTANTFGALTGLTVSIRGNFSISLSREGSALRINEEQTVVVRDTYFIGMKDNDTSLIYLMAYGELTLRGYASVSGNTTYSPGAGVYVDYGTFTMEDKAYVSHNTAYSASNIDYGGGGGVYIAGGTFTMKDMAYVSYNTAYTSSYRSYGGGVYVAGGAFTMKDSASVYSNTASGNDGDLYFSSSSYGGGVYVGSSGTFTMEDNASVSDNTAFVYYPSSDSYGGGVCVGSSGTFTMKDSASVSGNTASSGDFDTSYSYGGGVYVGNSGTFRIAGGTVYGSNEGDNSNKIILHYNPMAGGGVALYTYRGFVSVEYGTFDEWDFFWSNGNLFTTDNTVTVLSGVLQ